MSSPFKKSPRSSPLHQLDSLALQPQEPGAVAVSRSDDDNEGPALFPVSGFDSFQTPEKEGSSSLIKAEPVKTDEEIEKEAQKEFENVPLENIPKAKEVDADADTGAEEDQRKQLKWLLMLLCCILIIAAILVGVLYPKLAGGDDDEPTSGPTGPPNQPVSPKECEDAILIGTNEPIFGSTIGAFEPSNEPVCTPFLSENGPGVWFKLEGDGQVYTASTCHESTSFDTQISVFEGSCSNLMCNTANDQGTDEACGRDKSQVQWSTNPDETYYIYVHGKRGREGTFTLTVDNVPQDNLSCDEANTVEPSGLDEIIGNTWLATQDSNSTTNFTCSESESPGLWYAFSGNDESITISTCSGTTKFNAQVSIAGGGSCTELACVPDITEAACPLQYGQTRSFYGVAGQSYFVLIHGKEDAIDSRKLEESKPSDSQFGMIIQDGITADDFWVDPIKACEAANEVEIDGPMATGVLYQSSNLLWDPFCDGSEQGVFFRVTGEGLNVIADTCNNATEFDTTLTVLNGGDCSNQEFSCLAFNDQACGDQSSVKWFAESGQIYYVLLRSNGSGQGNFGITVTTAPSPSPSTMPSMGPTASPTTPLPSVTPSASPTYFPTMSPSQKPSETPSTNPTNNPTEQPSPSPSSSPSSSPSLRPTGSPSKSPTKSPTQSPSENPSNSPNVAPTTESPTKSPTLSPSSSPSGKPSSMPSRSPTLSPTRSPTVSPSVVPSGTPTKAPTVSPSKTPTQSPSSSPSRKPTSSPSRSPTERPTTSPSHVPTKIGTDSPTESPRPSATPTTPAPTFIIDPVTLCESASVRDALGSIDQVSINKSDPNYGPSDVEIVGRTCGPGSFIGSKFSSPATYDGGPAIWYKVEQNFLSDVIVSVESESCNTPGFKLQLSVFSGDCSQPVCVTGTSNFCSSRVNWDWQENAQAYYLMFHGFDAESEGTFSFTVGA